MKYYAKGANMQIFALTEPEFTKAGTGTVLKPLGDEVGLPGVKCTACGSTWIDPSAPMPFVDIPADDPLRKLKPKPVPLVEFRQWCDHVRTVLHLEPDITFRPACSFGVRDYWSRKISPAAFQFPDIGQMLVHESVIELLETNNILI